MKMGRSKFPGKPSKHVNRTRVNVLSTVVNTTVVGDSNPTVVTVEEGDNSKKGKSSHNSEDTKKCDAAKELEVPSKPGRKQLEHYAKKQAETPKTNKHKQLVRRKVVPKSGDKRLLSKCHGLKRSCMLLSTSSSLNTSTRLTRSNTTKRPVRTSTSHKLNKSTAKVIPNKDATKLVGKFILPSRSAHSSRVIKPNKRFINVDHNETRIIKKRLTSQTKKPEDTQEEVKNENIPSNTDEASAGGNGNGSTTGKLVLRQARLQIKSKTHTGGAEGPFSTHSSSTVSPSGKVICGVCGAIRFYHFVRQARKFNIYSCEPCRKFITKLIQRTNNKNITTTLTCQDGHGNCNMLPIARSQQWKIKRIAYNSRCPACWLKLCLRSFQIPIALKVSLSQLLPKSMQLNDGLFKTSLPLLTWQSTIENNLTTKTPVLNIESKTINARKRPVRINLTQKTPPAPTSPVASDIKRLNINLKGPRVKHVCRSASIVLGQPLATFQAEPKVIAEEKLKTKPVQNKPVQPKMNNELETVVEPVAEIENDVMLTDKQDSSESKSVSPKEAVTIIALKKEKSVLKQSVNASVLPMEITKVSFCKKSKKMSPQLENQHFIDIDYWENYDPDEIVCNGFSITAPAELPIQAMCFLCGSAGKETLLYCCICCEPYHPYCLEQGPPSLRSDQRYTWVCPKCTTCSACGEADKQKINCQKCHKAYHPQCFNTKWRTDDRPTVCSNCLRCKSCGTDNITKFVGNLALCLLCFKLRNKGNFCPICQCCYDDNDFDTKMMECGKCNKWVHAKCEGLSDEQYHILSILPESVEFLCSLCVNQNTPHWRKAVQSELRSCFNNILRLLSKNRPARDMLKLSPWVSATPPAKELSSARRLEFVDGDSTATDVDNSIDNELEQVNAIFKNKIEFGDTFNSSVLLNDSKVPISPSIVEIKNKLNCNEYFSLREFNGGMEQALKSSSSDELLNIYRSILRSVFPWFDPTVQVELNATICDASLIEKGNDEFYDMFDVFRSAKADTRICNLCKGLGDGESDKEARLLYYGQNDWVHANCALWSSEVFEEIDGSLQNIQAAVSRGRFIRCKFCKLKGATVGCCLKGCYETYHFPCAQKAACHFIVDKTMYCGIHDADDKWNIISHPREFEIKRSVYIEVDTKKKRYCDPEKIRFMIGSLSVVSLGRIMPSISDNTDYIVPVGYVCTRLFWSTSEPWKLVPYKITTSVLNTNSHVYVDRNFTVDHTLPKQTVEKRLREIQVWQRDDKDRSDLIEFEDYEEPQATGDILSPELTDAILQELPHDLLDGISVQDMLMGYEELMNMDFKNSEINCNDNMNLNMNVDSKMEEFSLEGGRGHRELKRSKSEVFQRMEDKMKPRNQQRSCSLTWLSLDNTLSPASKKRKITPTRENTMFMQLLQVDGAFDSSSSECGSPTHESELLWQSESEQPVTCEKCQCTYRTITSYNRHLVSCDAMSTSESETETESLAPGSTVSLMSASAVSTDPPSISTLERFHSLQTQNESLSTVVNAHTIMSESQKWQDSNGNGVFCNYQQLKPTAQPQAMMVSQQPMQHNSTASNSEIVNHFSISNQQNITQPVPQSHGMLNQNSITLNAPLIAMDPTRPVMSHIPSLNNMVDLQHQQQQQSQPVTIQSVPYSSDLAPILNIAHQNQTITIDAKLLAPNIVNPVVNMPQSQWVRPVLAPAKPRPKPRLVAKRPRVQGNTIVLPQSPQSVILQHIPSTNVLPFVDGYQPPTGQNVQYLATIAPQMNATLASQPQLVQLPDNNFLSLVSNIHPAMIIQQPRMDTGQLIVDSNGSVVWAAQPVQQVQPVYYGFETIVQNTVMQSQQFLPSTVPGVLTTNSSYSATTQVFQTSKLEPVMDGSYVLVNSNQVVNQPPAMQVSQLHAQSATVQQQQPQQQPQQQQQHQQLPTQTNIPVSSKQPSNSYRIESRLPPATIQQPKQIRPVQTATAVTTPTANSITLPVSPFIPEQGIPTNIVIPTPKPAPSLTQVRRPMSRVLPMQTNAASNLKKKTKPVPDKVEPITISSEPDKTKASDKYEKPKIDIISDISFKKSTVSSVTIANVNKIASEAKAIAAEEAVPPIPIIKAEPIPIHEIAKPENIPPDISKINKPLIVSLKPIKSSCEPAPITSSHITNKENVAVDTVAPKKPLSEMNVEAIEALKPHHKLTKRANPNNNNNNANNGTSLYYKIESADGFDFTATSLPQLWRKVFNVVQSARITNNIPPLPENALRTINDLDLLGLRAKGMKYLLEQLPDAAKCKSYTPVFHKSNGAVKSEDDGDEEACRRGVPFDKKREKYDMFSWLSSKHRTLGVYDGPELKNFIKKNASSSCPMATRFSKLEFISKYSVGVYRSEIHGRGLFSLRDIEAGEMVIEYAGEVIRSILTDKREKYYNSKGIGCYMFRVDDNLVVDATMKGNAARFINHSCDPNCYSKVVDILGCKHIIIFALHKIICGEELTYDYKFPFEEDKIPCSCGTKRCRKFLN